jgi:TrpR-related protein YerC/YecD
MSPAEPQSRFCGKTEEKGRNPEMQKKQEETTSPLYAAIMKLKNEDMCVRFFQDLCTVSELHAMEQRYEVAQMLNEGKIYSEILEATGASSATISRVNRALHYGSEGYQDLFEVLEEEKQS